MPEVRKVAVEAEVEVEAAAGVEAEVAVGAVSLPRSPGNVSGSKQDSNSTRQPKQCLAPCWCRPVDHLLETWSSHCSLQDSGSK